MKLIFKNTALLLGIFLLFSCGKRRLYQTALKFNTSALALSGKANGGLILVGERDGSEEYFSTSISIPNSSSNQVETTLDLPEGKWDFFAMVWDGSSNFTGATRCSRNRDFTVPQGTESTVNFNLTKSKCYSPGTGFNKSQQNGNESYGDESAEIKIPKIRLVLCSNLENIADNTSTCDSPLSKIGGNSYFKFVMGGFQSSGLGLAGLNTIASSCIPISSPGNSVINTDLRIGLLPFRAFGVDIKAYKDSSCSNELEAVYSFPKGFGHNTISDSLTFPHTNSQERNSLYIADNHVGYGKSTLSNQAPIIDCSTNSNWAHCFPGATASHQNGSIFHEIKNLFKSLIGTSDAKDPHEINSLRKETGVSSEVAFFIGGTIGTHLYKNGYTTCQSIPTTGDFTFQIGDTRWVKASFATPQKTAPSHFQGGGLFERRMGVSLGHTKDGPWELQFISEFNCTDDTKVGWFRSRHSDDSQNVTETELWYDTTDKDGAQAELYVYDKYTPENSSSYSKSRFIIKFKKTEDNEFTSWITGSNFQEGSSQSGYSPNSNSDFHTCTGGCVNKCYNSNGSEDSGCPTIDSGDAPDSSPINSGVSDFSPSSVSDGNAEGWSKLSGFSLDGNNTISSGSESGGYYNYFYRYLVKGSVSGGSSKMSINYFPPN